MDQQQIEIAQKAGRTLSQAFGSLANALKPALIQFGYAMRQIHAALWYAYIMDGAPYGETNAGLRKWLMEQQKRSPYSP